MITAHLQFFAEVFGRSGLVLRRRRPEGRPDPRPRRRLAVLDRWRRQTAPPTPLNNHLRRDIGLEPLPPRKDWVW
ncbi:MAG: hypothetical protein AB7S71_06450 [Dongiaceae bacterium]